MASKQDFPIRQGETFSKIVRWETTPLVSKDITGILQTTPVVITAPAHGLVDGWRVAVVSAKGMKQINDADYPPKLLRECKVLTTDTLSIPSVNSADFAKYTGGGSIVYYSPQALAGYTARMTVRDKIGGTVLASTDAAAAPLNVIVSTVDDVAKTIKLSITAANTAGFTWKKGVYDLEMVSPLGVVTTLLYGAVSVTQEVTS